MTRTRERDREYIKEWRTKNKDKLLVYHRRWKLSQKHGLTIEEYDRRWCSQLGGCAICGSPGTEGRRLCVDHDHETGRHRGLLCGRCNRVLGQIDDDIGLLMAMITYLEEA